MTHRFIREETSNGPEFHHLGVLDGDVLKDLLMSSLPDHWKNIFAEALAANFLDILRLEGYIVVQGNKTTVVEEMIKEVETYGQLKEHPQTTASEDGEGTAGTGS